MPQYLEAPITPDRIAADGISNGAMMSLRLACDLASQIAAVTPVEGPAVERLPDGPEDDGSSVVIFSWSGCADSAAVELYRIDGGGHTWPNGPQYLPVRRVGETNRDFDATEHIWEFFTAHPIARIPQSV